MSAIVYIADMDTYEILFINDHGRKIWGDIVGKRCWEAIQKNQDGPCTFCTNDKLLDKNGDPSGVYAWQFQNTENGRWYDCRDLAIKWIDERIVRMEIATDITERKQAEAALVESERKLADIIKFLPEATLAIDLNKRVIIWNKAIEDMTGIPAAEMIGQGDYAYTVPFYGTRRLQLMDLLFEDSAEVAAKYPMITHQGDALVTEVFCEALYSGKGAWIFAKASPLYNASGEIIGAIESIRDITERKQAEEKLRESEIRFRTIFENAPYPITISSLKNGRYVDVNSAFLKNIGQDKKMALGKTFSELGGVATGEIEQLFIDSKDKRLSNVTADLVHPNGEVHTMLLSTEPITINDEPCVIAITTDITEQRQAERDRERLQQQLHQSQKMDALGQLAGGVAHDFNNLLGGIMGAVELMQIEENLSENQKEYISMIFSSAERAGELTKRLLTFSRGGTRPSTAIDCVKIIKDAVEILKHTIDKRITVAVENHAAQTSIVGDDSLLMNALMNMGINASHAMPQGGTLTFTLENIDLDQNYCETSPFDIKPGNYIMIDVRDTGCGMAPEVLSRIFEPFFTTKEQGKGTGLGLSMVYGTVREHGGAITVYSEAGTGTVFHIYLPVTEGTVPNKIAATSLPVGTGTLLLIDDEELIRITAKGLLESLGYKVITAINGEDGIKVFAEKRDEIDLIILDMIMPVMGGREAFTRIREIDQNIPVIIASGFAKEEHMVSLKEQGISGFLQKPFRLAELAEKIHQTLK